MCLYSGKGLKSAQAHLTKPLICAKLTSLMCNCDECNCDECHTGKLVKISAEDYKNMVLCH